MGMPSVIVHGPQGCGKSTHAEKLRQAFGCAKTCDDADPSVYRRLMQEPSKFKAASTLYLTHAPPPDGCDGRRVLAFDEAMRLAKLPAKAAS